jgi:hypothetical protein
MNWPSFALIAMAAQASTPGTPAQPTADVLSGRIEEATRHRAELQAYLDNSPSRADLGPSARHQLNLVDQQIRSRDVEIMNLKSDLRLTRARLEGAAPGAAPTPAPDPGSLVPPAAPAQPAGLPGPDILWMGVMVLMLAPVAIAIAWRIMRGGRNSVQREEWLASEGRIQRIEDAVDAIAKDVERVSEGQRFLTNVLSEGSTPIGVPPREREPVARRAPD